MSKSKKKQKHSSKKKQPSQDNVKGAEEVETTLHGYPMTGPFTVSKKNGAVWYCDNKKCTYTQHGVFRRYNIQNWHSTKFGKKFTLCDGCVRQYKRQPKIQSKPSTANVNVKVNINGIAPSYQQPMPMQPGAYVPMQMQQGYHQPQPMNIPTNMQQQPQMFNPQYGMQQQQPMVAPQAYNFQQPQQPMMPMQQPYAQAQPMQQPYAQPQPMQPQQPQQQQPLPAEQKENVELNDNEIISNGIVKQGWMMKKGDLIKSWKKRYFVLKSNKLLNYYESNNAVMVKGTCKLDKVRSVKTKSDQSFEVDTPKRKWCFACKDKKQRDDWVDKIKSVAGI